MVDLGLGNSTMYVIVGNSAGTAKIVGTRHGRFYCCLGGLYKDGDLVLIRDTQATLKDRQYLLFSVHDDALVRLSDEATITNVKGWLFHPESGRIYAKDAEEYYLDPGDKDYFYVLTSGDCWEEHLCGMACQAGCGEVFYSLIARLSPDDGMRLFREVVMPLIKTKAELKRKSEAVKQAGEVLGELLDKATPDNRLKQLVTAQDGLAKGAGVYLMTRLNQIFDACLAADPTIPKPKDRLTADPPPQKGKRK